jgi:hypothetical protein
MNETDKEKLGKSMASVIWKRRAELAHLRFQTPLARLLTNSIRHPDEHWAETLRKQDAAGVESINETNPVDSDDSEA